MISFTHRPKLPILEVRGMIYDELGLLKIIDFNFHSSGVKHKNAPYA